MSDTTETAESNPLDRLFVDEDDRPEAINIGQATAMNTEEFVDRLNSIAEAADRVTKLAEDAEAIRQTGLRESDARDLIYGRNSGLRKSDIEAVFEALDDVAGGRNDLLVRLVADVAGLSQSETREVLEELRELRERYADE